MPKSTAIDPIFLVGAGGHCLVVVDALLAAGRARETIAVFDEDPARVGTTILGVPVARLEEDSQLAGRGFHVSIGNNRVRQALLERLQRAGGAPRAVLHPAAVTSSHATVAEGAFIAAQAVVGPAANVGAGVIVNHGAVIDHECLVGAFCHIAPGATLGGAVRLGARVLMGAGANVLPVVTIGEDCIIGAGAVVVADVPPRTTWVGVPARRIR